MSTARDLLIARLGRVPAALPYQPPRVDRRFTMDGIVFERWRIAGPRGEIPAYFLAAETLRSRIPAIVAIHPHGRQFEVGKSLVAGLVGDGSRAYGLAAAKAGFAVLIPDLPGFEDRRPPLAARKGNYALQGEAYERLLAMEALVTGATLQGWILADLSACVDALENDPRVDGGKVAAMGQSLGGQETIFGMVFDRRFAAGICSCGFSLVRLLVDRSISHNLALYVPGLLPDLDFDRLFADIAPRPITVLAGRDDPIYPVEGVEVVERTARAAYAAAGSPASLRFEYFAGSHDLPADLLAKALSWLADVLH